MLARSHGQERALLPRGEDMLERIALCENVCRLEITTEHLADAFARECSNWYLRRKVNGWEAIKTKFCQHLKVPVREQLLWSRKGILF